MAERERFPAEGCIVGSDWADAFVQRFYGMPVEHNVGGFDPENSADISLIRQWFMGAIEAGRTHGVRLERALAEGRNQASTIYSQCLREARTIYSPEGVRIFMQGANADLDGRTPLDLIFAGEGDRVVELLSRLTEGTPS